MDDQEEDIRLLIARVVKGLDAADAQRQLFESFERQVEYLSKRILGSRFSDLGDDAVIMTFTRAFRRLDTFKGESRFGSWLLRICRNCCLDLLRKQNAGPVEVIRLFFGSKDTMELSSTIPQRWDIDHETLDPFEATARMEQIEFVRQSMKTLKPHEYQLAVLVMKGFSNREIALRLDKTVPAVERLKLRTLEKLESKLRKVERSLP